MTADDGCRAGDAGGDAAPQRGQQRRDLYMRQMAGAILLINSAIALQRRFRLDRMGDALGFSIARLSTPTLELGLPDFLEQDLVHDALALERVSAMPQAASAAGGFAGRVQADAAHPAGGMGSGLLTLPRAFGAVYLGQSFAALVTCCNFSGMPLSMVGIKVELSTERSRLAVLYDSTSQPLPHLQPGQRHDFTVKHDVKDLGAHSLTCTATFVSGEGERRQQAQAFSFTAANPLVVRTKQRHVGDVVLLEAALENATREPMLLDTITFLPASAYSAERIGGGGASSLSGGSMSGAGGGGGAAEGVGAAAASGGPLSAYIQALPLMPVGGSTAFLFRLTKTAAAAAAAAAGGSSSGALGKIEIRWRGPMGQVARLQTQLISLPPQQGPREVSLSLARLPAHVAVGSPFTATVRVTSHVDRQLGPFKLVPAVELLPAGTPPAGTPPRSARPSSEAGGGGGGSREQAAGGTAPGLLRRFEGSAGGSASLAAATAAALASLPSVCIDGPQEVMLAGLEARAEAEVQLRLLALAAGQQALPALALTGGPDGRLYASLPASELFVDSAL